VKEVRNERRKLLATWFNNVGTAIISVGVLTPAAALILGITPGATSVGTILRLIASSALTGFGFHLIGTVFLLGYEP
jgi:hypothetical protein